MRAILTYHSIDPSGSVISVHPSLFASQMEWLAQSRVRVVPLEEISRSDGDAVALTFDDGFANFVDVALPLLESFGFPSTVFIVTRKVGSINDWANPRGGPTIPPLPLLDWPAIARAAERGASIGSHGRNHLDLAMSSHSAAADEISGSAIDIERQLGKLPSAFAYPYGSLNAGASTLVGEHYEVSCTTELRMLAQSQGAHLLPRLDMFYLRKLSRLQSFGTASFVRYLSSRRVARNIRLALLSRSSA